LAARHRGTRRGGTLPAVPRTVRTKQRALVRLATVVGLLLVLTGCQVKLAVDTKVNADGSGLVAVGAGLDDEALAKVGDLSAQLRVDDLKASGWTVTDPAKEDDGYTWVRATKPFADPAAATAVLDEVNGPDGAFGGWKVNASSSAWSSSHSVQGRIDLTKGMASFTDPALATALGGDPYGGAIGDLEKEQGRPVADMVDVRVTVEVPGSTKTFTPALGAEQPTAVRVSSSSLGRLVQWLAVATVLTLIGLGLVLLRRRSERRRRY
jgi:hypothetical protein